MIVSKQLKIVDSPEVQIFNICQHSSPFKLVLSLAVEKNFECQVSLAVPKAKIHLRTRRIQTLPVRRLTRCIQARPLTKTVAVQCDLYKRSEIVFEEDMDIEEDKAEETIQITSPTPILVKELKSYVSDVLRRSIVLEPATSSDGMYSLDERTLGVLPQARTH
ncbi:uncharacterized protein LOC125384517 [Haliotis rufescens]|uniref:uncharacterized protein LOC125384517 n=1 Tax=Haliotis rufescens TaxID=6454 RepID=UPI00201F3E33|nr:uncharacterized protein LOC125384517 [Haliotis rufescens]